MMLERYPLRVFPVNALYAGKRFRQSVLHRTLASLHALDCGPPISRRSDHLNAMNISFAAKRPKILRLGRGCRLLNSHTSSRGLSRRLKSDFFPPLNGCLDTEI